MIDNRTTNLNLPLPNVDNFQTDDVARLIEALETLDAEVAATTTTTEMNAAVSALVGGAPESLNTLGELAAAIGNNPSFASTVASALADKLPNHPATSSVLGGVKVGAGLTVSIDGELAITGSGSGSGLLAFTESAITPTTNGQTTFAPSGGYVAGQIEIYLNGVLLYGNGDDYTASDGTTIVLSVGVATTDNLLLRKWAHIPPEVAVNKTGDTMTGYLGVPAGASGIQAPQAQEIPRLSALPIVIVSTNTVAVPGNHYVFTAGGVTLTMPTTGLIKDLMVEVTNCSDTATPVVDFGAIKLRGKSAGAMTLNDINAHFRVQHSGNSTYGWA